MLLMTPCIYTYKPALPLLKIFKLFILTLSKPIAQRFSIFLVYSGLETGAPAYTCAQSRAVCLNISGFCLYYTKERGGEKQKVKSTLQSNQTARQYGRLQPIILPMISSTMFQTDHAVILEVKLEVRITRRANLCKHLIYLSLPSG